MNNHNLLDKLCLTYLKYTNKTHYGMNYEMPNISYHGDKLPDYLALYGDIKDYHKTDNTFVCFYEYDKVFNNRNGLLSAILFNDKRLLDKFNKKFSGVAGFISPDYSIYESMPKSIKMARTLESRIVSCYLVETFKKPCIPNISFNNKDDIDFVFDGIDKHSIIAISLKGKLKEGLERENIIQNIKIVCDNLKPKVIVFYNVSTNEKVLNDILSYPIDKSIKVILPNNLLLERNKLKKGD